MPKTKQSTISTFFTARPRGEYLNICHIKLQGVVLKPFHFIFVDVFVFFFFQKVLNKIPTSEEADTDPLQPFPSSTSTSVTGLPSGRKRGREELTAEADVVKDWERENVTESEATPWQRHSPTRNREGESEDGRFERYESPQSQERLPDPSSFSDSQPLPQAWSQDPLLTFSQYSDSDQQFTAEDNLSSPGESLPHSLQSEETFKNVMNGERRTSTQKTLNRRHSRDQENSLPPSKLTSQRSFLLNNWTEPKPPSQQKLLEENFDSQTEWLKQKSPVKKRARRSRTAGDEDGLAALFTQDSQGFRVIAHRGLQARSPLKDQSNVKTYRPPVVEEEEEDLLFTQDSQGNLVIKH
uniref:Uncharacterized protein n=1 Tax=Salarias fasciatus TaxID=181472 RepID=A0A672J5W5_SALFA